MSGRHCPLLRASRWGEKEGKHWETSETADLTAAKTFGLWKFVHISFTYESFLSLKKERLDS